MSSEFTTMSDLQRDVLQLLMAGWQTMEPERQAGIVPLSDLAAHYGLPPEEMRQQLALLEALGYVDNVHSMGMDQTQYYKGIAQDATVRDNSDNPTYFISENGKRLVVGGTAGDGDSAASPD